MSEEDTVEWCQGRHGGMVSRTICKDLVRLGRIQSQRDNAEGKQVRQQDTIPAIREGTPLGATAPPGGYCPVTYIFTKLS